MSERNRPDGEHASPGLLGRTFLDSPAERSEKQKEMEVEGERAGGEFTQGGLLLLPRIDFSITD